MSEPVYLACISDDNDLGGPVKLFTTMDAAKTHLEAMAASDQYVCQGEWEPVGWVVGDGEQREAGRVIDSFVTRGPLTLRYWMQVVALEAPADM